MLLRIDMPGLSLEDLDLRFDRRSSCVAYRPEALEDLIAWNELQPEEAETFAPHALNELLLLCYAQWRNAGGFGNGTMEAMLSAVAPVCFKPMAPVHLPLHRRLSLALQSWLGLLDLYEDVESV